MEQSYNNIEIPIIVEKIYTITGVQKHYSLGNMSYGEWLIYKNNQPCFYMNIFDEYYKEIKDDLSRLGKSFIEQKLKEKGLSLKTKIFGIRRGVLMEKSISIPRLPKYYLQ